MKAGLFEDGVFEKNQREVLCWFFKMAVGRWAAELESLARGSDGSNRHPLPCKEMCIPAWRCCPARRHYRPQSFAPSACYLRVAERLSTQARWPRCRKLIAESAPHGNRLVGNVSVRAGIISLISSQTGSPKMALYSLSGERPLSRVENPLLMLGWPVASSLIPLDTPGIAVLESFAKRAFVSILC